MFSWRITKYNPKYRDSNGAYTKDEWTSYSDVGKIFNGHKFTLKQYLEIENSYIKAIKFFMECLNVSSLRIIDLEKYGKPKVNSFSLEEINIFNTIKNYEWRTSENLEIIIRLILRETLWCKLETAAMYVHFGYDYYMYIGSEKKCDQAIEQVEKIGLFVEPFQLSDQ